MTEQKKRELLQQYINGSISEGDRHLLEREALDDHFLFEALEGYSSADVPSEISIYGSQVKERPQIFIYVSMAASFLLLAAAAFLFNQYNTSAIQSEQIVMDFDKVSQVTFPNAKESTENESSIAVADLAEESATVSKSIERPVPRLVSQVNDHSQPIEQTVSPPTVRTPEIKTTAVYHTEPSSLNKADLAIQTTKSETVAAGVAEESIVTEISIEDELLESDEDLTPVASRRQAKGGAVAEPIENAEPAFVIAESVESSHARKSYPVGGLDKFEEYIKEEVDTNLCDFGSVTFKFQILSDGSLDDVEVTETAEPGDTDVVKYGRCIGQLTSLLKDYGKWETVPPNRKIRRTWTFTSNKN